MNESSEIINVSFANLGQSDGAEGIMFDCVFSPCPSFLADCGRTKGFLEKLDLV